MKHLRHIAVLGLAGLTACSSGTVKETLGLDRASPDEYRVVSRPPLSVPPEFSLRPPSATAETPGQLASDKQAQSLITGKTAASDPALRAGTADTAVMPVTTGPAETHAEASFLQKAGADKADPSVRDQLVEERITVQDKQAESNWWDIMSTNPPKKDTIVDAKKESQRIKTDSDAGKPVNEGETAVVKQRDTGVLGRIFGY